MTRCGWIRSTSTEPLGPRSRPPAVVRDGTFRALSPAQSSVGGGRSLVFGWLLPRRAAPGRCASRRWARNAPRFLRTRSGLIPDAAGAVPVPAVLVVVGVVGGVCGLGCGATYLGV